MSSSRPADTSEVRSHSDLGRPSVKRQSTLGTCSTLHFRYKLNLKLRERCLGGWGSSLRVIISDETATGESMCSRSGFQNPEPRVLDERYKDRGMMSGNELSANF